MKKLFVVVIALTFISGFSACPAEPEDELPETKLPNLTIKNESSFDLADVKFAGISFSAPESNALPKTTQAVRELTENDINKTGYITFIRSDIGIACRAAGAVTIEDTDYTFTFLDSTVVEEIANTSNQNPLSKISFLSKLAVERNGINIPRNDTVNLGEATTNTAKQVEFILKNTSVGKLLLGGSEPVKITSADENVFSVVQPEGSEITPGGSLPFKINFNAPESKLYSGTVTVSSNDQDGNFVFTINAEGVAPKPIVSVFYSESEIGQNGTIDAGEALITQSNNITVEIKNTGTETLTIDTANITITGAAASAFTRTTTPSGSVSAGNKSSFIINCAPVNPGENNAILTIPTNDESRNPVIVFLKVSGIQGSPILALTQGDTVIQNNSLAPVDFGIVDMGGNPKDITFTVKNTGNIALALTGSPLAVVSANSVFSVVTQPANTTIQPGASVPFVIRYTPTAEVKDEGKISILNNSSGGEFVFTVTGSGYEKKARITVKQGDTTIESNGEYEIGEVLVGKTIETSFSIGNTGDANLTFAVGSNIVDFTDNVNGFFTVTLQPAVDMVVTPGNTTTFTLRFAPTKLGSNFAATVRIKSNSWNSSEFTFRVRGNGRGYIIGETGPAGGIIIYATGNQFKESMDSEIGGSGTWNTAISAAAQYKGGGLSDWYLPNMDELDLVYKNIHKKQLGDFYDDYYWSSTEYNDNAAWQQDFETGEQFPYFKVMTKPEMAGIIAIRSFTLGE